MSGRIRLNPGLTPQQIAADPAVRAASVSAVQDAITAGTITVGGDMLDPTQVIVAESTVRTNNSTSFPGPVRLTDRNRLGLVIVNPHPTETMQVGYGQLDTYNHTSEPDAVPPGQEWVGGADPRPVFVRFPTTSGVDVDVVTILGV